MRKAAACGILAGGLLLQTVWQAALAGAPAVSSGAREAGAAAKPEAKAAPILHWRAMMEPGCGGWITSVAVSPRDSRHVLVGGDILGIGLSDDRGESWQPTFGLASWEIADFTYHPTDPAVVWVGTMGGPYRSGDGGRNWEPRRAGLPPISAGHYSAPVQKVLFDPGDASRLLAFGGSHRRLSSPGKPAWGAVWESRDGGATWKRLATIAGGANILAATFAGGLRRAQTSASSDFGELRLRRAQSSRRAVEPSSRGPASRLYAAADDRGVFISEDGGATWTARNDGLPHVNIERLTAHPAHPDILWAALGTGPAGGGGKGRQAGGIWRSDDAGKTWTAASDGLGRLSRARSELTSQYRTVAVAPSDGEVLLTCDCSWEGAAMYRSGDGGKTWQAVARRKDVDCAYPAGMCMTVIEFDPRDSNVAFAAGSEYMLRTLDGGRTWVDVTSVRVAGVDAFRGRGYSGLCATGFRFYPADPNCAVLLAMDHGNFWQSRDGLRNWTWGGKGFPQWGGSVDMAFAGKGVMYVALGQQGVFDGIAKTADGGASWTILAGAERWLPKAGSKMSVGGLYAPGDDPNAVWAIIGGQLYDTSDGGRRWSIVHPGPGLNRIAGEARRPRCFYVSGRDGLLRTEDGKSFSTVPAVPPVPAVPGGPRPIDRIVLDCSDPPRLYATSWRQPQGGLWRLQNGAWTQLRDDRFIAAVAVDPTDANRIAVATDDHPYHDACFVTGVWVSPDGGRTFSQQNAGLPCLRGDVIAFNPHDPTQLIFGTLGRGFFVARWPKGS